MLSDMKRRAHGGSPVQVLRATAANEKDARTLLDEYYRELEIVKKDTAQDIDNFLTSPDFALWIAYVNNAPAACVVLRPLANLRDAGECKRLYVRPEFRGQGLADTLLDAQEEWARDTGLSWIYLDSKSDLKAALAVYERRGYSPCKRYNDNPQATIFLRKPLGRAADSQATCPAGSVSDD